MIFQNFDVLQLLYRIPGILIGISIHEWAHAFVAYKCGDPTAKNLGRMSIDPTRHFSLLGSISLLIFGFGWAKPVPVNTRNFKKPVLHDILVSLAGVVANFLLAFVLTGIYVFLMPDNEIVINFLIYAISINLSLSVFNLIPIPPLDGSRIVRALFAKHISFKFWEIFQKYGNYILWALILTDVITGPLSYLINEVFRLFISFFIMFI